MVYFQLGKILILPWPTLLVVVTDDVLVVGVGVLGKVALDQVLALVRREAQEDVQRVDVPGSFVS